MKKPETPKTPKSIPPSTDEEKALWSLSGLSMVLLGFSVWQREKIKGFLTKNKIINIGYEKQ